MKQFLKYAFRWQLSSIILAPCIYFLPGNAIIAAVVSNLIGASIFFWVDKFLIFKVNEVNYEEAKASLASDSG